MDKAAAAEMAAKAACGEISLSADTGGGAFDGDIADGEGNGNDGGLAAWSGAPFGCLGAGGGRNYCAACGGRISERMPALC